MKSCPRPTKIPSTIETSHSKTDSHRTTSTEKLTSFSQVSFMVFYRKQTTQSVQVLHKTVGEGIIQNGLEVQVSSFPVWEWEQRKAKKRKKRKRKMDAKVKRRQS